MVDCINPDGSITDHWLCEDSWMNSWRTIIGGVTDTCTRMDDPLITEQSAAGPDRLVGKDG